MPAIAIQKNLPLERDYNGWFNWSTWNAALWINNDQGMQEMFQDFDAYKDFVYFMVNEMNCKATPDGALWSDADESEMQEMLDELKDGDY